jgi:hypothetical protein
VLAGFYELGRRHGGADQDPGPADRVLKTEGIGDGDVKHPADASERVEALEVISAGDGLLAPAAQTTEAAGLGCLGGLGRIVEVAELAIDQRCGFA